MAKMPEFSDKFIIIIAVIGLVCLGLGSLVSQDSGDFTDRLAPEEGDASEIVPAPSESFDLEAAKVERILGDENAPIKIAEHSSFTCGHCGNFHKDVFKPFKEKYIDTGKAYLVFSDFPLNAPALHASMVARCVTEDQRYFEFVESLFAEQDKWAYEDNYTIYLKNKAAEFGIDDALFDTCMNNKELQEHLVERIRAVQTLYQVNSTPSFVINNQKVISGTKDFASFDEVFRTALKEMDLLSSINDGTAPEMAEPEPASEPTLEDIFDQTSIEVEPTQAIPPPSDEGQ